MNKVRFSSEKKELPSEGTSNLRSTFPIAMEMSWERICEEAKETFSKSKVGEYLVGERIGKGAFGKVCKGVHSKTGKFVAIKEIPFLHPSDDPVIPSILNEIEVLQSVKSPNIVELIEYYKYENHYYLIFEYIENGSLKDLLQSFGPLPEPLLRVYAKQILEGLISLHNQNIIHRDIKSENILITKESAVKIADFGFATSLSSHSPPSAVGSPYWMAPELYEREMATKASDIWSFGCTIIELLTGNPPYSNLDPISAGFQIVENPMKIPGNISADLKSLLELCFEKNHEKRTSAHKLFYHPFFSTNFRFCKKKVAGKHPTSSAAIIKKLPLNTVDQPKQLQKLKSIETFSFHSNIITMHSKLNSQYPKYIDEFDQLASYYKKVLDHNCELIALSNRINRDLVSSLDRSNSANRKNDKMKQMLEREHRNSVENSEKLLRFQNHFANDEILLAKVLFDNLNFDHLSASKKGVLKVQKGSEWKKRYVILRDNFLLLYHSQSHNEPSDVIIIENQTVEWMTKKDSPSFAFSIVMPNRKVNLCGANETISKNWMIAIEGVISWYSNELAFEEDDDDDDDVVVLNDDEWKFSLQKSF